MQGHEPEQRAEDVVAGQSPPKVVASLEPDEPVVAPVEYAPQPALVGEPAEVVGGAAPHRVALPPQPPPAASGAPVHLEAAPPGPPGDSRRVDPPGPAQPPHAQPPAPLAPMAVNGGPPPPPNGGPAAPPAAPPDQRIRRPDGWLLSVYTAHVGHAKAAEVSRLWGRAMGVLAVALSTVTGTTLFTTLQDSPSKNTRTFVAVVAALAALVTALKTFFGYTEAEAAHRKARTSYGDLKHELQMVDALDGTGTVAQFTDFRKRWKDVEDSEPTLTPRRWSEADRYARDRLVMRQQRF